VTRSTISTGLRHAAARTTKPWLKAALLRRAWYLDPGLCGARAVSAKKKESLR